MAAHFTCVFFFFTSLYSFVSVVYLSIAVLFTLEVPIAFASDIFSTDIAMFLYLYLPPTIQDGSAALISLVK